MQRHRQLAVPLCPDYAVYPLEFLIQDIPVQKQDRVERLVLQRGGHVKVTINASCQVLGFWRRA